MLVLMEQVPDVDQVLKVNVPTPVTVADTPHAGQKFRWARRAFLLGKQLGLTWWGSSNSCSDLMKVG